MKRMTEAEYTIELLEKVLAKLSEIEQRLDNQDAKLRQHISVQHAFRSTGKRHSDLQGTQVAGRY
jgi:hypothetical protein